MATESYGRTDDGIAWVVHHRLGGPWWWTMKLPDGQVLQSTYLFDTEQQALEAVEDARLQAVAVRPAPETLASLRARAEAAEAEAERLRAVITKAVDDLPEWSDGALKHLSPAEVMADEVRMKLRRALGGAA